MRLIASLLALFLGGASAGADVCLGEVQLIAKAGEIRLQEATCLVFPSLNDQIIHETNPNCAGLSIDDILVKGISVPLLSKGLCPFQTGDTLSGYVVLLENGTLIIQ